MHDSIKTIINKRLPSIKHIDFSKATNPITDFIGDEIMVETKKPKPNKNMKILKTNLNSIPYKEVPDSYHCWWKKEDLKQLYVALTVCGYNIELITKYLNYKWTYEQIRRKLKTEYRIRPQLIEKAMLLKK